MIDDSMKSDRIIGMIQPKIQRDMDMNLPQLHEIGCLGKIISFKEKDDGTFLIDLKGISRFRINYQNKRN